VKAERARRLARLAYAYHVTPAQLRACTVRDLNAMEQVVIDLERKRKKKGGS
jgi:hypothetical protein